GDIALQSCAQILREQCRDQDIAARLGGAEFTVLMIGAIDDAVRVADRIRIAIADQPAVLPDGRQFRLTISVGVAALQSNEEIEALLARADVALYSAKQNGRDRVEVAP